MQEKETLDDWIRHHSTGFGWVASDGFDLHGPFDDPVDAIRRALSGSDFGDFVTLSAVAERVDPAAMAVVSADELLDALFDKISDYAPLGGLEDVPEEALEALEHDLAEATRRALAAWRSAYPAHLPASVWRTSDDERMVTAGDLKALVSLRRKSA